MNKLRERAMSDLMEHIHYEDETSNYVGLCPINKVVSHYFFKRLGSIPTFLSNRRDMSLLIIIH
jgi:hypothetical protein